MNEFDIPTTVLTVDEVHYRIDRNGDGRIDFGEFSRSLKSPVVIDTVVEWVKSLSIHELLADSIPRRQGAHPLRTVSMLTKGDVRNIVSEVSVEIEDVLIKHIETLKLAFGNMDKNSEANLNLEVMKFETDLSMMSCGAISDFHGGLIARIGKFK